MKLRRKKRYSPQVSTSALNDIMFFLLLFFLLASAVVSPHVVKLSLPKSSSGQPLSQENLYVSVTKELEYYIEGRPVTFDSLYMNIKMYQQSTPNISIILHADQNVAVGHIIQFTDIANQLNVKVVLATQGKNDSQSAYLQEQ